MKKRTLTLAFVGLIGLLGGGLALDGGTGIEEVEAVSSSSTAMTTIKYYPCFSSTYDSNYFGPMQTMEVASTTTMGTALNSLPKIYGYSTPIGWYGTTSTAQVNAMTVASTAMALYSYVVAIYPTSSSVSKTSYTIDYGCALQNAFQSSDLVYVEYSNGTSGSGSPGICLGKSTGVVTASIPSDATTLTFSSYTVSDGLPSTQRSKTVSVSISPSSDTNKEIFLTGKTADSSTDYQAYLADAGYITIKNALNNLNCSSSSSNPATTVSSDITSAWNTINSTTSTYKTDSTLGSMTAYDKAGNTSIAFGLSRYDYVVNKYGSNIGTTYNPLSRPASSSINASSQLLKQDDDPTSYVAISAVSGIALSATAGYIFLKKRKEIGE